MAKHGKTMGYEARNVVLKVFRRTKKCNRRIHHPRQHSICCRDLTRLGKKLLKYKNNHSPGQPKRQHVHHAWIQIDKLKNQYLAKPMQ